MEKRRQAGVCSQPGNPPLEKALFALSWFSLPFLHCSPKSPIPPTFPPRNPYLEAEKWGLKDAAGHGAPSTWDQGFSGSTWNGLKHLRQEMNHLGWSIILPSLFSIFSQQSLFSPTKNQSRKVTGKCRHVSSAFYLDHTSVAGVMLGTWHALFDIILSRSVQV